MKFLKVIVNHLLTYLMSSVMKEPSLKHVASALLILITQYTLCISCECDIDIIQSIQNDTTCDWIPNDENQDTQLFVGYAISGTECVEMVRELCPWSNIAKIGNVDECWCQKGGDRKIDNDSEWRSCWFRDDEEDNKSKMKSGLSYQCISPDNDIERRLESKVLSIFSSIAISALI